MSESGLDKIQRRLYSRTFKEGGNKRERLSVHKSKHIAGDWATQQEGSKSASKPRRISPFAAWFLVISLMFFTVSVGIAALFLIGGRNTVSTDNVQISFFGPVVVPAGDVASVQVSITNHNPVVLRGADLLVEFPPGARAVADRNVPISRHRESIGDIRPGETIQRLIKYVPFGEIDTSQELSAALEYRVDNSSALFFKDHLYSYLIGTSPIRMVVDTVNEINAGQEVEIKLTLISNVNDTLNDVILKAEYPFGFAYTSGVPEPARDKEIWELGQIPPDGSKQVIIRGIVEGQEDEERVFRFSAGLAEGQSSADVTPLVSVLQSLVVRRPFLALQLRVNGVVASEHALNSGSDVQVDIYWENTLPTPLIDAAVEAKITGDHWNRASVRASNGFFRSSDNTVLWSQQTGAKLATLDSGSSGTVGFRFVLPTRNDSELTASRNPQFNIEVSARGRRVSESGVPEELQAIASTNIQINSDALLTGRVLRHTGPFENSGPIPPRVDQETTYTIVWSFTNTTNELTDVDVATTLPSNVRFVGPVSPSGEDIIFHPVGGRVVWSAGRLGAGLGGTQSPREAAFQVAITPGLTQQGQSPTLINQTTFTAKDAFTGKNRQGTVPPLTTLFNETQYRARDESVVR
jgi:hypothetical protein